MKSTVWLEFNFWDANRLLLLKVTQSTLLTTNSNVCACGFPQFGSFPLLFWRIHLPSFTFRLSHSDLFSLNVIQSVHTNRSRRPTTNSRSSECERMSFSSFNIGFQLALSDSDDRDSLLTVSLPVFELGTNWIWAHKLWLLFIPSGEGESTTQSHLICSVWRSILFCHHFRVHLSSSALFSAPRRLANTKNRINGFGQKYFFWSKTIKTKVNFIFT